MDKKTILIVLDGWGIGKEKKGNAIAYADTANFNDFLRYPNTQLAASGHSVGLPVRQIGGSEVGHLHIGAGRVVEQEILSINKSIDTGCFFKKGPLLETMNYVLKNNSNLHLMGLLSNGGVHSHINHLFSLLELAKKKGVSNVFIHAFLDGRDVAPKSAEKYLKLLKRKTGSLGIGKVATISGRYYAMDRDNRWEREEKIYDAMVFGNGRNADDEFSALDSAYKRGETDEFVMPTIIEGAPKIKDKDAVLFFNFRSDRSRETTRAFVAPNFKKFSRAKKLDIKFTAMTEYDRDFDIGVVFKPQIPKRIFPEILALHDLKQLRIAETEKYAHVTYFFNAGRDGPFEHEDRILIPSPKVATYDLKPKMSADKIAKDAVLQMKNRKHDFILLNFANADMVGHTGKFNAAVDAVSFVDKCLGKVVDSALRNDFVPVITADHGNAETMFQKDGTPHTAHTLNKVPFIIVSEENIKLKKAGALGNTAPTLLRIMGLPKPKEMGPGLF